MSIVLMMDSSTLNWQITVRIFCMCLACLPALSQAQVTAPIDVTTPTATPTTSLPISPTVFGCLLPETEGIPGVRCNSTGLCISNLDVCNYIDDCGDNEDEVGCIDSEACMDKRAVVDQVLQECTLQRRTVQSNSFQNNMWNFNETVALSSRDHITEVTLDTSILDITNSSLFRVTVSDSEALFFISEGAAVQTKSLSQPQEFSPLSLIVMLEQYQGSVFIPVDVPGPLSLTIASGECGDASLACQLAIEEAIFFFNCSFSLGEQEFQYVYSPGEICPLRPDCKSDEYSCLSGVCIPDNYVCDGQSDCGDSSFNLDAYEDEEQCQTGCPSYLDPLTGISICLNGSTFPFFPSESQDFRPSLFEVLSQEEAYFITDISLQNVSFGGLSRFNISNSSSTIVVYQDWRNYFNEVGPTVYLKSLLAIKPGDYVTLTMEYTDNALVINPQWRLESIDYVELRAIPLINSCEESRICIDELFTLTNGEPFCSITQVSKSILDQSQHCLEPPRITFISPDASVSENFNYSAICVADGLPTPSITWIDENDQILSETNSSASFMDLQLSSTETSKKITCRAVSGDLSDEQTVEISLINPRDCASKLDAIVGLDISSCSNVRNITRFGSSSFDIFQPGLLYNASFSSDVLSQYESVVDVELRVDALVLSPPRKKRSFGNTIYRRQHERYAVRDGGLIMLYFDPPVLIPKPQSLNVFIEFRNTRNCIENNLPKQQPRFEQSIGILSCLTTCDLNDIASKLNDACFSLKYFPELEQSRYFLSALERCEGFTDAEPVITVHPEPLLETFISSFFTQCEADNSVRISWYKKEWFGYNQTEVTGNILSFVQFSAGDQGLYYCKAHGGGDFENVTVDSDPVAVVLSDRDTYLARVRFRGLNYTDDLLDPNSDAYQTTAESISSYFLDQLLESQIISDFTGVNVQELLPGSVVSDVRLTLNPNANTEDIRNIFLENDFFNLDPDNTSLTFQAVSFCDAESLNRTLAGNLSFPKTIISQMGYSLEMCPSYSAEAEEPRASRICHGDLVIPSYWGEPVLNNCFDDGEEGLDEFYQELNNRPVTNDNVTEVSHDLADVTQSTDLDGEDLVTVAEILEMITNVNSSSPEVTSNIIEIVDNVLNLKENAYTDSTPMEAPSRILQSLERQLNNLQQGGGEVNFTDVRGFVGVVARSVPQDYFTSEITFGNFFKSQQQDINGKLNESDTTVIKEKEPSLLDYVKASITLPATLLDNIQYGPDDVVPLTFIIHRTSHLFTSSDQSNGGEEVESLIIAATVEGQTITNLEDPVITRFHLLPVEDSIDSSIRRCVFWDFKLANGFGDWSSEGCELVSGPQDTSLQPIVECHCVHLTNFAVLVDIQGDIGSAVLDVLSIIGCVISIIALIITIITFLVFKKLRSKRPQQILINLCFALLGLYLFFLIGIDRANLKAGCVIFGALIHYFCLASIAWMCIEATNMYFLFVKVFDTGVRHFMLKSCLAGWGLPLVVVVISAAVKPSNYTGDYCFPQAGTLTLYIGVIALIAIMLCYNMIIFTLVVQQLTCKRKTLGKDIDKRKETLQRAQNAFAISVLLGLAWIFGFLAIGGAQFIFNLLFLIFNSLQGLFVFLLFCLRQDQVRSLWLEKLLPGRKGRKGRYENTSQPPRKGDISESQSKFTEKSSKTGSSAVNPESMELASHEL